MRKAIPTARDYTARKGGDKAAVFSRFRFQTRRDKIVRKVSAAAILPRGSAFFGTIHECIFQATAGARKRTATMTKQHISEERLKQLKRIARYKLATFSLLTLVFMFGPLIHDPARAGKIWEGVSMVLLAYSVLMAADAMCELFDENAPRWSNVITGFLLPIEPRGFPSLVAMVSLISVFALAIGIRGCCRPAEPAGTQPAPPAQSVPNPPS